MGAEVRVGLCVERGVEMVVGVLGVLKAGGAYVPLDPSYPRDRLAFMIEDSAAHLLLVHSWLLDKLPDHSLPQVVCLDLESEAINQCSDAKVVSGVIPDNLAYVIYTSGSTGKPKGVQIAHRGLCNLVKAELETFALTPECQVLQFASLSFDASIFEIVMALCVGAALHVPDRDSLMPGQPLLQYLTEKQITNVTLPPTALLAVGEASLPNLHTIIVAGEACPADTLRR